jgi:hypothetical protein
VESLEIFAYLAKASDLGKFLGIFFVKFDQKHWGLFIFLALKVCLFIWQTTTFHYIFGKSLENFAYSEKV